MQGGSSSYNSPRASGVPSFKPSVPPYPTESYHPLRSSPTPPATNSASDNQVHLKPEKCFRICLKCHLKSSKLDVLGSLKQLCPICLSNPKDMAFGCGHQVNPTNFHLLLLIFNRLKHWTNMVSVLIKDLLRVWTRSSNVSDLPCTDPDKNKALLTSRPSRRLFFSLVHLLTTSFGI